RERRLAGAGRTEEHDGGRRLDAVAPRLLRLGERQDHAALDQILLTLHAADRLPELRGQPEAAELLDAVVRGVCVEAPALEVDEVVATLVAGGRGRVGRFAGLRSEDR